MPPALPVVGLGYAAVFGVVASYVAARPGPVRDAWFAVLSTNLVNLSNHPVRSLVGSAFVTDDSPTDWVVLAFVGLTVAAGALGSLRLAALLAPHLFGGLFRLEVSSVGHVVAIGVALLAAPALIRDHRSSQAPNPVVA